MISRSNFIALFFFRTTSLSALLLFMFISISLSGQGQSEVLNWEQEFEIKLKKNYDSALLFLDTNLKGSEESTDNSFLNMRRAKVETLVLIGSIELATESLIKLMILQKKTPVLADSIFNELLYAQILLEQGELYQAYRRGNSLIEPIEELEEPSLQGRLYFLLGSLFMYTNMFDSAINYFSMINDLECAPEYLHYRIQILIAQTFLHQGKIDESLSLSRLLLKQLKERNFETLLPQVYILLYDLTKESTQSDLYLKLASRKSKEVGYDQFRPAIARISNAMLSVDKQAALKYSNEFLSVDQFYTKDLNALVFIDSVAQCVADTDTLKFKQARAFLNTYKKLTDFNNEVNEEIPLVISDTQLNRNFLLDITEQVRKDIRLILLLISCFALIILAFIYRLIFSRKADRSATQAELGSRKTQFIQKPPKLNLDKERVELKIQKKLNDTDWGILELLATDPLMTNQELADKIERSADGVSSSLRKMYVLFEIEAKSNKKPSLIFKAVEISNSESAQDEKPN